MRACIACGARLPRNAPARRCLCGQRECAREYPHIWRADAMARRAYRTASARELAYLEAFHVWARGGRQMSLPLGAP